MQHAIILFVIECAHCERYEDIQIQIRLMWLPVIRNQRCYQPKMYIQISLCTKITRMPIEKSVKSAVEGYLMWALAFRRSQALRVALVPKPKFLSCSPGYT